MHCITLAPAHNHCALCVSASDVSHCESLYAVLRELAGYGFMVVYSTAPLDKRKLKSKAHAVGVFSQVVQRLAGVVGRLLARAS